MRPLEDREHAFPGKGRMKPHEEELMKLRKKLADVEEEREILKKVTCPPNLDTGNMLEFARKRSRK